MTIAKGVVQPRLAIRTHNGSPKELFARQNTYYEETRDLQGGGRPAHGQNRARRHFTTTRGRASKHARAPYRAGRLLPSLLDDCIRADDCAREEVEDRLVLPVSGMGYTISRGWEEVEEATLPTLEVNRSGKGQGRDMGRGRGEEKETPQPTCPLSAG